MLRSHHSVYFQKQHISHSWSTTGLSAGTSAFYSIHSAPLSAIISSFDINHHLYTDDTQIYMFLSVFNAKESLEKLQHWVMAVSAWMTGSKLKLNDGRVFIYDLHMFYI